MEKHKIHKGKATLIAVLVIAALLSMSTGAQAQSTIPSPSAKGRHCVVHLEPVPADSNQTSKSTELGCYDTFEEAIFVATDGTVNLPRGISLYDVTGEMLRAYGMGSDPRASVTIGTDYDDGGFGTWFGTYTYTADESCSPTLGFAIASMPSGWNDRVNSARSYSECYKYYHYQDIDYGGSSITCDMGDTCYFMGAMGDQTSSERWRY